MASARKKFKPKKNVQAEPSLYAAFVGDLLDGTVKASLLVEVKQANKPLDLEYDDPNG